MTDGVRQSLLHSPVQRVLFVRGQIQLPCLLIIGNLRGCGEAEILDHPLQRLRKRGMLQRVRPQGFDGAAHIRQSVTSGLGNDLYPFPGFLRGNIH